MMQKHNCHVSFSLYICALAISDTTALLIGMSEQTQMKMNNELLMDVETETISVILLTDKFKSCNFKWWRFEKNYILCLSDFFIVSKIFLIT